MSSPVSRYIGGRLKGGAVTTYEDNIMTSIYTVGVITSEKTVECRATVSGVTIDTSGKVGVLSKLPWIFLIHVGALSQI